MAHGLTYSELEALPREDMSLEVGKHSLGSVNGKKFLYRIPDGGFLFDIFRVLYSENPTVKLSLEKDTFSKNKTFTEIESGDTLIWIYLDAHYKANPNLEKGILTVEFPFFSCRERPSFPPTQNNFPSRYSISCRYIKRHSQTKRLYAVLLRVNTDDLTARAVDFHSPYIKNGKLVKPTIWRSFNFRDLAKPTTSSDEDGRDWVFKKRLALVEEKEEKSDPDVELEESESEEEEIGRKKAPVRKRDSRRKRPVESLLEPPGEPLWDSADEAFFIASSRNVPPKKSRAISPEGDCPALVPALDPVVERRAHEYALEHLIYRPEIQQQAIDIAIVMVKPSVVKNLEEQMKKSVWTALKKRSVVLIKQNPEQKGRFRKALKDEIMKKEGAHLRKEVRKQILAEERQRREKELFDPLVIKFPAKMLKEARRP